MKLKVGKIYKRHRKTFHFYRDRFSPWAEVVDVVRVVDMRIDEEGNGGEMYAFECILLQHPDDELYYKGYTNECALDNFEEIC